MKDYYAILGVVPTAEDFLIRAAYRALASEYHPDHFKGDSGYANRRMVDLNEAYSVLSDARRRADYDQKLRASKPAPSFGRAPPRQKPVHQSEATSASDQQDPVMAQPAVKNWGDIAWTFFGVIFILGWAYKGVLIDTIDEYPVYFPRLSLDGQFVPESMEQFKQRTANKGCRYLSITGLYVASVPRTESCPFFGAR